MDTYIAILLLIAGVAVCAIAIAAQDLVSFAIGCAVLAISYQEMRAVVTGAFED